MELAVRGLVWRDERVLLVRMNYGPLKGKWLFPGGLAKPGETVVEAVVREVQEESGVHMEVTGVLGLRHYVTAETSNLLTMLTGRYVSGEPRPDGREVDDARFFTPEEALALDNLYAVARMAITLCRQDAQGLSLYPGPDPHFLFVLPAGLEIPPGLVPSHP
jgi:NADH pyrophosphatase NudC (nudix superfamily)